MNSDSTDKQAKLAEARWEFITFLVQIGGYAVGAVCVGVLVELRQFGIAAGLAVFALLMKGKQR